MSLPLMIALNIGAAALVSLLVATVMLLPRHLHRPFAAGHTQRQWAALRRHRRRYSLSPARVPRSVAIQTGRNG